MKKLPMPKIGTETQVALAISRGELEAKRETTLSLPGWATSRIGWLGTVMLDGQTTHYLTTGLPPLSNTERATIEEQARRLEALCLPADGDDERKLIAVTKMMMALASGNMSETGAQAKGEAYLFALADVPAWAVEDAIGLWYVGGTSEIEEEEFKWAPSPAVLLRSARESVQPYQDAAMSLRRLINSRPLKELLP